MEVCRKLELVWALLMLGVIGITPADHRGREFLISFPYNGAPLSLRVTGTEHTSVHVESPCEDTNDTFTIGDAGFIDMTFPQAFQLRKKDTKETKAVLLTSSEDVSLVVTFMERYQIGSYLAFPIHVLAPKYIVMAAHVDDPHFSQLTIAARHDSTTVVVKMKLVGGGICHVSDHYDGEMFTVSLRQLEVLNIVCSKDTTGTAITADGPISVVSAVRFLCVSRNAKSKDFVVEMLLPVKHWGKEYVLSNPGLSTAVCRILASENDTEVKWSHGGSDLIDEADFIEYDTAVNGTVCILSSKPVSVAVFMKSAATMEWNGSMLGDSLMIILPSTNQFHRFYRLQVHTEWNGFATVTTTRGGRGGINMDKQAIALDERVGSCAYDAITLSLTRGQTLSLAGDSPFALFMIGVDYKSGLGFSAGYHFDRCPLYEGYEYNGQADLCLKVHTERRTWAEAYKTCKLNGDILLTLETEVKHEAVKVILEYLGPRAVIEAPQRASDTIL